MTSDDWKLLGAYGIVALLYLGLPVYLYSSNRLQLSQPSQVFNILAITLGGIYFKMWITHYVKEEFTFTDQGFQFSLMSAAGFLSMIGMQQLNGKAIIGDAIRFPSMAFRLSPTTLNIGFFMSLGLCMLSAFLVKGAKKEKGVISSSLRFVNYCIGIFAFTFYLMILLSKGV